MIVLSTDTVLHTMYTYSTVPWTTENTKINPDFSSVTVSLAHGLVLSPCHSPVMSQRQADSSVDGVLYNTGASCGTILFELAQVQVRKIAGLILYPIHCAYKNAWLKKERKIQPYLFISKADYILDIDSKFIEINDERFR